MELPAEFARKSDWGGCHARFSAVVHSLHSLLAARAVCLGHLPVRLADIAAVSGGWNRSRRRSGACERPILPTGTIAAWAARNLGRRQPFL